MKLRFLFLALIGFLISASISILTVNGLLPYNHFTSLSSLFGSAWIMIFFILAMRNKIKDSHNEAQNKMLFLQSRYASMGETVGNIAHQWKQPLNAIGAIQNSIKAALIFQGEISKEKLLESVETSFKLLQHLAGTIDTFYNFLAPKNSYKSSFLISDVFETIRKITEYSFQNNNIQLILKSHSNPTIQGDANEFTHAMLNLILNAKDALDNSQSETPTISVEVIEKDKTCMIFVSDNAGGISIKPINKVFDWHVSSKEDGSGVGLYMTKNIIEKRFGGTITVENKDNGACFTIELPYTKYGEYFSTANDEERLSLEHINQLSKKIIELKELEKALKRWADIFEQARWGIAMHVGTSNAFETTNPTFSALFGYTTEELKTITVVDLFAPESLGTLQKIQQEAFKNGYGVFEATTKRKDGSLFPVSIELIVIKDEHGEILYHIANVWDLTEKKEVEERLKLKKFAIDNIKEAVFLADENGSLAYVNDEACRSLGYTQEELLGMNVADVDPDWPKERWPEFWNMLKYEKTSLLEVVHQRKDSSTFPAEVRANYFEYNGIGYNLGLVRDITEQKKAKENLLLKEFALDKINEAVFLIDKDSMFHYVNEGASNALGYTKEELLTMGVTDLDPNFPVEAWRGHWEDIKKLGTTLTVTQHRRKDGSIYSIEVSSNYFEYNGVGYSLAVSRDISERLLLEAEKENRIIKMVAENSPDVIIRYDVEGRRTYANPKAGELLGVEIGKSPSEITPIIDKELYMSELKKVIKTGAEATFEITYINVVGGIDYSHIRMVPEFNDSGNISSVLMIGRNVTDQKRAFDALAQKEKELRALAESSPGMMGAYYMRPDGSVCMPYASPNINELFGITPEEIKEDATPLMALHHPDDAEMIVQTIQESAQKMSLWHIEYRIIHPTKGIRWMEGNTMPQPHSNGGIVWYGYVHDITERKEMELSLEKHRISLANAQKISHIGSWDLDLQTNKLSWSEEYYQILEIEQTHPGDVAASFETLLSIIHPDDREYVIQSFTEWQTTMEPYNTEHRLLMPDGRIKYIQQLGGMVYDTNGHPLYAMGTIQDITERKEMEQEIKNAYDFLNMLIDSIPDPIFVKDRQHTWTLLNKAFCELIGQPKDMLIGKSDYDFFPKEQADIFWEKDEVVYKSGNINVNDEFFTSSDGTVHFIQTVKTMFTSANGESHLVGSIRDFTERKMMEEKLRQNEKSLKEAQKIAKMGSWELDIASETLTWSDETYRIFELEPEQITDLHKAFYESVHPYDREMVNSLYMESVKTKLPFEVDHRIVMPDGRIKYVLETCETQYDKDGNPVVSIGTVLDITERKLAENTIRALNETLELKVKERTAQLLKSLEFNEGIINAIPDLLFEVDSKGTYLNIWAKDEKLLAAQKELLLGRTFHDVLSPEAAKIALDAIREADKKELSFGKTIKIDLPQGEHWFELSVAKKGSGNTFICISRDITERQIAEVELREREETFRAMVENSPDVIIRYDLKGRRTYINPIGQILMNRPLEELIGKTPEEYSTLPDTTEFRKLFSQVVTQGEEINLEAPYKMPDGEIRWGEQRIVPEKNAQGEVTNVLVIGRDLTERKNLESLQKERLALEERLSKIVASAPEVNYIFEKRPDNTVHFTYLAPGFEELFGLSTDAALDDFNLVMEHIHSDDRETIRQSILITARDLTDWHEEFRINHTKKGIVWIEGQSSPELQTDGTIIWYGFFHNITERKEARKHQELIDSAINSSKEAIYINDKNLSIIYVNDGACEMLGYTREELTSMKIYEIDAHFTTDQIFELRDQTIDINNAFFETKHRTKDGRILDVEIVGNPFVFDGIDVLVSVVKDISLRKETEKQLKLLETAINHASEAVYIVGDGRSILYASDGASRMLDYTRDELTEMYIYDIDAQMSKSEIDSIKEKILTDGKIVFQTKHKTKKGDLIDVEITSSMFDFDNNNLRISIVKKL